MSEPRAVSDRPLEELQRFALDHPIAIDVSYADVVRAQEPNHSGPFEIRVRGIRQPDGKPVRAFVPLHQVEGALIDRKVLPGPAQTDALAPTERAFLALPFQRFALTFTKRRKANGDWYFEVAVRDGADAVTLQEYLRALHEAASQALPALAQHGLYAGPAEVISMAGQLFAARITRREGRDDGTR